MRDIITEIWQTARRNKLRTTLTGFAVAWGIFMLIVLLGAGNGLINANLKQSDRFLSSSMVVFGGWTSKPYQGLKEGRDIRLHERDMEITAKEFKRTLTRWVHNTTHRPPSASVSSTSARASAASIPTTRRSTRWRCCRAASSTRLT